MSVRLSVAGLLLILSASVLAQGNDPLADSPEPTLQLTDAEGSQVGLATSTIGKKNGLTMPAPRGQVFFGFTGSELHNASGFDVDYDYGAQSSSSSLGLSLSVHTDKALGRYSVLHRRYSGWFDTSDFDGLALYNLGAGAGLAFRPMANVTALGFGFSMGGGAGLQYAETFLDNTVQGFAEVNAAVFVRLWIVTVQMGKSQRVSTANTLDDRSASPRTSSTNLSFGFTF